MQTTWTPCNRRDLLDVAAGVCAERHCAQSRAPPPAAAREVDPALAAHWMALMQVLEQPMASSPMCGDRRSASPTTADRAASWVARNGVRTTLLRVEARWSNFASWLLRRHRDRKACDAATRRTLDLAREADYSDVIAYALQKQHAGRSWTRCHAVRSRWLTARSTSTTQRRRRSRRARWAAAQALAFAGDGRQRRATTRGRDPSGSRSRRTRSARPVVTVDGAPHYVTGDMARCRLLLELPHRDGVRDESCATGRASTYATGA